MPIAPKAFETLLALVERNGHVVERAELIERVWPDAIVEEQNLTFNVGVLRKLLGQAADGADYIETVPKRGYRFAASVTRVEHESDELIITTHSQMKIITEESEEADDTTSVGPANMALACARASDTPPVAAIRNISPARYLFNEIGHHKAASVVILSLAIATVGFLLYRVVAEKRTAKATARIRIIPLTSFPGQVNFPAFSPDGKEIAFSWDGGESKLGIYVKLLDTGTALRLTNNPDNNYCPAWSPDGRYIAFIRESATERTIRLVPALGGPEIKVTQTQVRSRRAPLPDRGRLAWSPDGKFLIMADRFSDLDPTSIFLTSIENGETRRLTSPGPSLEDILPAPSPDGQTVAFIRKRDLSLHDIYLVSINGGEPRRLTFDNKRISGLTWADDSHIVFASNRAGDFGLWRISVSGSEPEQLAVSGQNLSYPTISRQGDRLAYTLESLNTNIWRIDLPGATQKTAKNNNGSPIKLIFSTRQNDSPQISPDGKRIVFASDRSGSPEIWACDSDGRNAVQLTSFNGPATGTPRWSPDGRQIVFDSRAAGNADIYVIGADGGAPRRLTTETSHDVMPSWSRDGRWIYFYSNRSGSPQLWKIPADGGQAAQVTQHEGFEAFDSPDGNYLYYTKGRGVAGIWRVPVDGGEETLVPELAKAVFWRSWVVTQRGIYFVAKELNQPALEFFDFATRRITQLAALEKAPPWVTPGLAVSPDGRWALYTQIDQNVSDIMLVENFR